MKTKKQNDNMNTCQRLAAEDQIREKVDEKGNKWVKVYFGGGRHLENWLNQCKELGEVHVEEISAEGLKCYEEGGEKLYRIWLKIEPEKQDELFAE